MNKFHNFIRIIFVFFSNSGDFLKCKKIFEIDSFKSSFIFYLQSYAIYSGGPYFIILENENRKRRPTK